MPIDAAARPHRTERVLGVMALVLIALSVISIVAILVGGASRVDVSSGVWPTVYTVPLIALPLAILLLIAFIVVSAVRRARDAR